MNSQKPLINLCNVSLVREQRTILSDINFAVNRGDFVVITGPNGGGKTTLMRLMLKLIKPTSGTISYHSLGSIGYLPQKNMIDSHFPISVREVIESGLISAGVSKAESTLRTDEILELLSLQSHAAAPIGRISGGQLQRTLLGRAIISKPEMLFLDEPLSYLDKHFEEVTYDLLRKLSQSTTILLVSHEITKIAPMATRHIIVDRTLHECLSDHHAFVSTCD